MFTQNLIEYCKTDNAGLCPMCHRKLKVEVITTPARDNINIICENCEKSEFFTGTIKKSS